MLRRPLRIAATFTSLLSLAACASSSEGQGDTGQATSVGAGGTSTTTPGGSGSATGTPSNTSANTGGATGTGTVPPSSGTGASSGTTTSAEVPSSGTTPPGTGGSGTGTPAIPSGGDGMTGAGGGVSEPGGQGSSPGGTATGEPAQGAGGTGGVSSTPEVEEMGGGGTGGTGEVVVDAPDVDVNGKANAAPGEMTSVAQDYLRLGEIRILNNNWGSEDLGCNAPMSVFVNQDSSFGWSFNRGDCDTQGSNSKPDFPQVEFGIHPFGIGNHLVTSPEFSSTTLMPIQIKDIQSASVTVQNLNANLQREASWNITFEFWLSERNPVTDPNPGVYAELMAFWGWQNGRWPSPPNGMGPTGTGAGNQVSSGGKSYTLWVQDDTWADGWRYFQFRADDGPQKTFNGTIDVKAFIDYLVNSRQYSTELWVTRLEVGSEIDDETQGTVSMSGISFEVNGESRSAVIGGN